MTDRRQFLRFLAGSPLFAAAGLNTRLLEDLTSSSRRRVSRAMSVAQQAAQGTLIQSPTEALDVFDFEPVAKAKVPVAHWAYLATGTDDDGTIRANREGFNHWALKPRRLVDVRSVDASVSLYGTKYPTPIVINPVGSQKAFHPLGEIAVARAAKAKNHLQVLSTVATTSIEDAIAARGSTVWFQLYHDPQNWARTKQMVQRAERAGSAAVVFTVDLLAGSNRSTMLRGARLDTRKCTDCHPGGPPVPGLRGAALGDISRKPNLNGYPAIAEIPEVSTPTWEFVDRLRGATSMKVLLKGIVTREDAELSVQHGVDGLFCSNHGGRAENSMRATIDSLPEVVQGTGGRIPVICDGGFRRGTDIFKAMALGAASAGIGRPYIWGLAAFGQEGVEMVLAILRYEFELVMKQMGTTSVAAIGSSYVAATGM